MTMHPLNVNDSMSSRPVNNLAILFFLLGALHIYSFLRRRSQHKIGFGAGLSTPPGMGILLMVLTGVMALLAF
ncbi:hypothetical protein [Trichothermofontia sp.]